MQDWFIPFLARGEGDFIGVDKRLRQAHKQRQSQEVWRLIAGQLGLARLPIAQAGAAHAGLPEGGYWLRADPVYLRPDHKGIYVLGLHDAALSWAQAQALVTELNAWLVQDNLRLYAVSAHEWYLHSEHDFLIASTPLSGALGCDMAQIMVQGAEALRWQSRLLEWQMLLQRSAVNVERVQQGLLPVSSLWLWGEGQALAADDAMASNKAKQNGGRRWFTDSPWLTDYLRRQHYQTEMLTIDLAADPDDAFAQIDRDAIVVLLGPEVDWLSAKASQMQVWRSYIAQHLPRIALNLMADDGWIYQCRPWHNLRFWR